MSQPLQQQATPSAGNHVNHAPTALDELPQARPRRFSTWLIVGAVIVGVGLAAWRISQGKKREQAPRFETAQVDRGRIVARVTATGTLSPLVTVQVGSQVSGRIQSLSADFNTTVKKGQVIARIDPRLFEATVERNRANFIAAKGNLAKARAEAINAERQFERSRTLAQDKLVAAADRDTAETAAAAARASAQAAEGMVAQAQASLHEAEINLAYTTIYSPISGVVISRTVDVGQTVAASLQAPTLFTIAEDLSRMQVDTSVAESDVGKLKAGMNVTFVVDAYPGERFKGVVRQIRNAPQTVQNVVTYDAVIDVKNDELKLKPGMTANVTFVHAERDDVLRVPNAALRFRPSPELLATLGSKPGDGTGNGEGRRGPRPGDGNGPGGDGRNRGEHRAARTDEQRSSEGRDSIGATELRSVWVLKDGQPRPARIRPGITDGSYTELLGDALSEGTSVITELGTAGEGGGSGPGPGGALRPGGPFRRGF